MSTEEAKPAAFDLDHVAIAVPDAAPVLDMLAENLGAAVLFSERADGFRYAMTRLGTASDGMNLEVLEPCDGGDRFLERFLRDHGPGPHHITFQTTDLRPRLSEVVEAAIEPVKVRLDWAPWQEAFVLPEQGHGTVLQLAGSTVPYPPMAELEAGAALGVEPVVPRLREGTERGWARQRPGGADRARMRRVLLGTPDLDGARRLFVELLGGRESDASAEGSTIVWTGGEIRLVRREEPGVIGVEIAGRAPDRAIAGLRLTSAGES
jgi:methylmalonyl-CoA/ethylmalonyl-CoA epimerase